MKHCPNCKHPLPPPTAEDWERMPTRDRERVLERLAVRKGGGSHEALPRRPMIARFVEDADGNTFVTGADSEF